MYEVINYTDKRSWENELNTLPEKDVFYLHSYCTLYLTMGDGEPTLFIYKSDQGEKIYYVFFKRPIQTLPFINDAKGEELYDIITPPYGYGGPFYLESKKANITAFRKEFERYCQKEKIISEFIRFHPLYQNQQFLCNTMDVSYDRETIFIDLNKEEKDLQMYYHKNHRRNLKKAVGYQLQFNVHRDDEALGKAEEFYSLYVKTMEKLGASKYSFFSQQYIEGLLLNMKENSLIATAYYNGKIVAAALCIYEGENLHYHLGCSDKGYLNLGVNVYLFHCISTWAKQKGFRLFHLGGGHIGRDSLFQFKHRFNREGILRFFIGKKIHNDVIYNNLVSKWESFYDEKLDTSYFPKYRANQTSKVPNLN